MLGASVVALVYGKTAAHFSGAFIAVLLDRILEQPELPLQETALETLAEIEGGEYPFSSYAATFRPMLEQMFTQAQMPQMEHGAYMEKLDCYECQQVVLGALYASCVSYADMDRALVTAVNHSGKSAVVAALTGAILGAAQGEGALPEFYMEGLDAEEVLLELLHDLGLAAPESVELCWELNKQGFRLPMDQLEPDECAQALFDMVKGKA